jgi:peptidoglycan/xylan/chitin deacetylase (PgdA/CDA1 family)
MRILLIAMLIYSISGTDVTASGFGRAEAVNDRESIAKMFLGKKPLEWGESVTGVYVRLNTVEKVIALTLDACGSSAGKGYDSKLIDFLIKEKIPATLFINARWIEANPDVFRQLAENPLFDIANHGLLHKPASVTGRVVYGIKGTADVYELMHEIEGNAEIIERLTGRRPRYYRSGTAYYDEIAVKVSEQLSHQVIGFSLLGDAGATYNRRQVKAALMKARPGDIALLHMNHPGGRTADGVIDAVPELRRLGYRFVKLSSYGLQSVSAKQE